jgi:hypothetical protein
MTRILDGDRDADSGCAKPKTYGIHRNLLIDCLRGFSILIVVGTHGALTAQGYFGVSIFFVISGFLITRNTLKRYGDLSRTHIFKFYRMRGTDPAVPSAVSAHDDGVVLDWRRRLRSRQTIADRFRNLQRHHFPVQQFLPDRRQR